MFVSLPIFFNETESLSLSLTYTCVHIHMHTWTRDTHNSYCTYIHTYIPLLEERNEANNGACTKRQEFCFTVSDLLVLVYRHYGWPIISEHDNKVIDVCDLGTDKHSMSEQHDDTGPDVSSLIMGHP